MRTEKKLPTTRISLRVNTETYLRLDAIAAEKGLSIGKYLQNQIEKQDENLVNDLKLIQADTRELINMNFKNLNLTKEIFNLIDNKNVETNNSSEEVLIEILFLLREISQPAKVSAAQKKVKTLGLTPYNYLEK